jgi:glutathione S-transferase
LSILARFTHLDDHLRSNENLVGHHYSVAAAHLFVVSNWAVERYTRQGWIFAGHKACDGGRQVAGLDVGFPVRTAIPPEASTTM